VTIDASFISLSLLLPAVRGWFVGETGEAVALIKPQFEAGRKAAAVHAGVIKDESVHERVLEETLSSAQALGFYPVGLIPSPIKGPKGNIEFLVDLRLTKPEKKVDFQKMIANALKQNPV
jgi:23S rRNA (cytidine1920-2'-O)/16S rRNA (cytidine1409-2'-O)-methyltransferase